MGLLTTTVFAEEVQNNQESYNENSFYINVGQSFGSSKVVDKITQGSEESKVDFGKMKYATNFAIGYDYFLDKNFSLGIQVLIPMMDDLKLQNIKEGTDQWGEYEYYDNNLNFSNTTVATFATIGYKVLTIDRFTTSINGGLGVALHYFIIDQSNKEKRGENYSHSYSAQLKSSTVAFAYQVGLSESVKLTNNIALTLGVSYLGLGTPTITNDLGNGDKEEISLKSNGYANVSLGLNFSF